MHEDDTKRDLPRSRTTDSQKRARRVLSVLAEINKRPSSRDSRTIAAENDARELVDEAAQVHLPLGMKTAAHVQTEQTLANTKADLDATVEGFKLLRKAALELADFLQGGAQVWEEDGGIELPMQVWPLVDKLRSLATPGEDATPALVTA